MKNNKGTALIIAIVLTMGILILLTALLPVVRTNTEITQDKIEARRQFYDAETGINYALHRLQSFQSFEFFDPTKNTLLTGIINTGPNGCRIETKARFSEDSTCWNLTSIATDNNNHRCIHRINNISTNTLNSQTMAMRDDMEKDLEFASGNNSYNKDMNTGDLYFGGVLNIDGTPTFSGKVTSSSPKLSKTKTEGYYDYYGNYHEGMSYSGQTRILRNINDKMYKHGIWDKTKGQETAFQKAKRLKKIFPDGYAGNQAKVDFEKGVAFSYDEIANNEPDAFYGIKTWKYTGSASKLDVTINDNIVLIKSNNKTDTVYLNKVNTVLFPGNVKNIKLNESSIGSSVSLYAKNADYWVNGDLYYKELAGYKSKNKSWGNDIENVKKIRKAIKDKEIETTFALLTSEGNVTINNKVGNSKYKINNDCLLMTASIFCPNGTFGVNKDANAKGFAGAKRVINIGSIMMKNKGLYRLGNYGITASLCNDARYKNVLKFPKCFKILENENGLDLNLDDVEYTIRYN